MERLSHGGGTSLAVVTQSPPLNRRLSAEPPSPNPGSPNRITPQSRAVAHEMHAIQALKRLSIGAALTTDPDLPDAYHSFHVAQALGIEVDDDDEFHDADYEPVVRSRSASAAHSSPAPPLTRHTSLDTPTNAPAARRRSPKKQDRNSLLWVPASIHPELAPQEWKTFVENKVADMDEDDGRRLSTSSLSSLSRSPSATYTQTDVGEANVEHKRKSGLQRSNSRLSNQIRNQDDYTDGSDVLESRRRSSLLSTSTLGSVTIEELSTQLSQLTTQQTNADPFTLARSLSVSRDGQTSPQKLQRKKTLDSGAGVDSIQEEEESSTPLMGLRRAKRTNYSKPSSIRRARAESAARERNEISPFDADTTEIDSLPPTPPPKDASDKQLAEVAPPIMAPLEHAHPVPLEDHVKDKPMPPIPGGPTIEVTEPVSPKQVPVSPKQISPKQTPHQEITPKQEMTQALDKAVLDKPLPDGKPPYAPQAPVEVATGVADDGFTFEGGSTVTQREVQREVPTGPIQSGPVQSGPVPVQSVPPVPVSAPPVSAPPVPSGPPPSAQVPTPGSGSGHGPHSRDGPQVQVQGPREPREHMQGQGHGPSGGHGHPGQGPVQGSQHGPQHGGQHGGQGPVQHGQGPPGHSGPPSVNPVNPANHSQPMHRQHSHPPSHGPPGYNGPPPKHKRQRPGHGQQGYQGPYPQGQGQPHHGHAPAPHQGHQGGPYPSHRGQGQRQGHGPNQGGHGPQGQGHGPQGQHGPNQGPQHGPQGGPQGHPQGHGPGPQGQHGPQGHGPGPNQSHGHGHGSNHGPRPSGRSSGRPPARGKPGSSGPPPQYKPGHKSSHSHSPELKSHPDFPQRDAASRDPSSRDPTHARDGSTVSEPTPSTVEEHPPSPPQPLHKELSYKEMPINKEAPVVYRITDEQLIGGSSFNSPSMMGQTTDVLASIPPSEQLYGRGRSNTAPSEGGYDSDGDVSSKPKSKSKKSTWGWLLGDKDKEGKEKREEHHEEEEPPASTKRKVKGKKDAAQLITSFFKKDKKGGEEVEQGEQQGVVERPVEKVEKVVDKPAVDKVEPEEVQPVQQHPLQAVLAPSKPQGERRRQGGASGASVAAGGAAVAGAAAAVAATASGDERARSQSPSQRRRIQKARNSKSPTKRRRDKNKSKSEHVRQELERQDHPEAGPGSKDMDAAVPDSEMTDSKEQPMYSPIDPALFDLPSTYMKPNMMTVMDYETPIFYSGPAVLVPPGAGRAMVMYYHRFPLHIERAIYRLSHLKLANPRRPLVQQVLLSNFMYAYLDLINQGYQQQQQQYEAGGQIGGVSGAAAAVEEPTESAEADDYFSEGTYDQMVEQNAYAAVVDDEVMGSPVSTSSSSSSSSNEEYWHEES